jgi:PIN domain nuclease of toxin-antitoxin system
VNWSGDSAPEYILDASAVLALLLKERGGEAVSSFLPTGAISAVNLAEVVTKLLKRTGSPRHVLPMLDFVSLPVIPWDESSAHRSLQFAHLADLGLSIGDRACITEAMHFSGAKVVTADRSWKKITAISKRVILIR